MCSPSRIITPDHPNESTGIIEVKYSIRKFVLLNNGKAMVWVYRTSQEPREWPPAEIGWPRLFCRTNRTWRFVPDAGPSCSKELELYDLAGNLLTTGNNSPIGIRMSWGLIFPNRILALPVPLLYVIKSVYENWWPDNGYSNGHCSCQQVKPVECNLNVTAATPVVQIWWCDKCNVTGELPHMNIPDGINWQIYSFAHRPGTRKLPGLCSWYGRCMPG